MRLLHLDSLAVHEWPDLSTTESHILPIYATSSFDFEDIRQAVDIFGGQATGHTYSRYGNPTVEATAAKIAALESYGSDLKPGAVMTNSGMSAIHVLLTALLRPGDAILTQANLYGGTTELLRLMARQAGIDVIYANLADPHDVETALAGDGRTRLIYLETPANPTLACVDIAALTEVARRRDIPTAIDNTFATPYLQQPLLLGVDYVIHSTTKYLNGHGNAIAGVVIGRDPERFRATIWNTMKLTGANCSPFDAWLTYQGMKTLPLRMERHSSNALHIARVLDEHKKVRHVNYPGLEGHAAHPVACKQMRAFGGMLSVEVEGGIEGALRVINALQFCSLAPTLGDVDTLVLHPATSSHVNVDRDIRIAAEITDGLIRVSVGIEHPDDILDDLLQAIG